MNATPIAPAQATASDPLDAFREDRVYLGADHVRNERRTWIVAVICAAMLAAQVAGGVLFNSMALIAGGLHMAAHVAALLVAAFAYAMARRFSADPRFSFGAGKLGYLAGFANAVVLAATALVIVVESVERMIAPQHVHYGEALWLAIAGLGVNLVCMWLLKPAHVHVGHDRDGDLNLSAAHLHIAADSAVSVLAILALAAGQWFGWTWADPIAGLMGAVLVAHFALSLVRRAGAVLLDMNPSAELTAEIRARFAGPGERLLDLHLWKLGPGHHAAVLVVEAGRPLSPQAYRARIADIAGLSHVTVEVRAATA